MSDDIPIINPQAALDAQLEELRCPACGDAVFELLKCVTLMQHKLDKEKIAPKPVLLYRCLSCKGYLYHKKEGGFGVMERDPEKKETPHKVTAPVVKGPW